MSDMQSGLSADEVMERVDRNRREAAAEAPPPAEVQAYREATAVLAAVADPENLRPLGEPKSTVNLTRALGAELIPATGRRLQGAVMLAPEVRQATIQDLAATGRIEAALAANPNERGGRLQEQLERYMLGTASPLATQDLPQLEETLQVAVWLGDSIPGVPQPAEVADRAAYLRLLAPFETIAGDAVFRGRKRELDTLRSYIGVLPPESLLRRIRDIAFKWAEPTRQPALSISGPGGVGKSALVARFIIEHSRLPDEGRVPFAYLDFDRVDLDVGDPVGLVAEMIRQLATEFPAGGSFASLNASGQDLVRRKGELNAESDIGSAESLLADLLGIMARALGPRPYVVILDTFEVVQLRGEARAFPLWRMLGNLQERYPFLRVVIAGRAPVSSLRLADKEPSTITLGELDREAAIAFLGAQGVADQKLAGQIVDLVGGVPLSLKLAGTVVARDQRSGRSVGLGSLLLSASTEVVQGQLYARILDHIDDERVRRLVHPGLVLRRITPEIILKVLNEPCHLGITDLRQAHDLFDQLHRETSVVSIDDEDGSLLFRSDLRRLMLKLLITDQPERVERIRRSAIAFYRGQRGLRAKAEENYHRLFLDESIDPKDLADREVRASIQAAIAEFPIDRQLWLSTLGFQVPEDTRRLATTEQQHESQAAYVEELLAYAGSSILEAERIVLEGTRDLQQVSPLFRSAARVAAEKGDFTAARGWIQQGLEQSVPAGATRLTTGLIQELAWLERADPPDARAPTLGQLADLAVRQGDVKALAQHRLQTIDAASPDAVRLVTAMPELLGQLDAYDLWGLTLALLPAVSVSLGLPTAGIIGTLRGAVSSPDGPYRRVVFEDRGAQAALTEVLSTTDLEDDATFGRAFLGLGERWPYRVLFVEPAYGRGGGESLSESAS
jgi:hypothetical protein